VIAQTPVRPATAMTNRAGDPGVALGRPIPVALDWPISLDRPVAGSSPPAASAPYTLVRAQSPDVPPPGTAVVPPPPVPDAPLIIGDPGTPPAPGPTFWGKCKGLINGDAGPVLSCGGRSLFQSDHAFDQFISPVTNPFEFEDPRALTEVRPLFFYQTIPHKNYLLHGGSAEIFGAQARVALTERWSFVMNKLGGVALQPHSSGNGQFGDDVGLSELDLGPKYTFLRGDRTGTLGAAGLTFQIPIGSRVVFQDTGKLSLMPYVTMGQSFGHSQYGSFNALGNFGYSFATDNKRSEYFSTNLHLDYDLYNLHRIYPLVEMTWRYYTRAGTDRNLGFEGGDLINFGSTAVSGRNNLDLSVGARFKISEAWQLGTAFSWPLVGTRDINDFRWTIDMIFRY
jgi:hypothetical protein